MARAEIILGRAAVPENGGCQGFSCQAAKAWRGRSEASLAGSQMCEGTTQEELHESRQGFYAVRQSSGATSGERRIPGMRTLGTAVPDGTQWWESGQSAESFPYPYLSENGSKGALCLDNAQNPVRMNAHLDTGPSASVSTSTSGTVAGPFRIAKYGGNLGVGSLSKLCAEGKLTEVVEALDLLVQKGTHVDSSLFYSALRRCTEQKDLVLGRRIHALCRKSGFGSNAFVANHVIRLYASHGRLVEATQAFTEVPAPDIHMWASIIMAHSELGLPKLAIKLYRAMCKSAVKPNSYIFVAVLKACATAEDLASGKEVHADIVRCRNEPDIFVGNGLVNMYAKCGSVADARKVFDNLQRKDVVTWNAMLAGYVQHGFGKEALAVYASMQQVANISPDHFTFSCLLKACGIASALHEGKTIHSQVQLLGLESHVVVANSLVDMYAKCGMLVDARTVFDNLQIKDVVTWTAMIAGYAQQERVQEALTLYANMQDEGKFVANKVTFSCLLKACTGVGALHHGQQLHAEILERGLDVDLVVGNCLVDMYAKCGRLSDACRVFDKLPTRDVVTWNSLLNGYAEQGEAGMAIQCFKEMQQQVKPNDVTFCCLLVACSHEGLVEEGLRYFKKMVENYGIAPNPYHVTCMVDLLGRSNRLDEAEKMLRSTPFKNDIVGWITLLNACKIHGDIGRGRLCFERLVKLEPKDARAYVLLASIYANVGRWRDVRIVERLRQSAGAKKKPAKACIEVNKELHEFIVGEERGGDVSFKLRGVNKRLKEDGGHVPQTELVLKAGSDGQKEDALCGHAEKLALAYGLLNTREGTTLLVTKNLRMCNDCHSGTKIMSRLEKREIIVRDAHRLHRFVDGSCSCGDRC